MADPPRASTWAAACEASVWLVRRCRVWKSPWIALEYVPGNGSHGNPQRGAKQCRNSGDDSIEISDDSRARQRAKCAKLLTCNERVHIV